MWLNQRTVDAIRIMAALAADHPRLVKAARLADITGITPLNVQKTANILVGTGFVQAVRGPHGGLRLGRSPDAINVGEIARAFEPEDCPVNFLPASSPDGRVSQLLFKAHREFFKPLEMTPLSRLASNNPGAE